MQWRWQIAMSNRMKLYFLTYGIELLVVFVGVVAGYTLNNWAEDQRNQRLFEGYMKSLDSDMETDMRQLHLKDSLAQLKIQEMTLLVIRLKMNDLEDIDTINYLVKKTLEEVRFFHPSKATYESIKQAGQINIIRDTKLKNDLIELYESHYEQLKVSETIMLDNVRNRIEPFVMENYDYIEFRILNPETLQDYRFANSIQLLIFNLSENLRHYKESYAKAEQIQQHLQEKILKD